MFNDRDLAMIGAGAAAAVLCLLLPVSFAGKVAAGLCTLVASMTIALLRLGMDRLPVEEWLKRRFRYLLRPRRWTFQVRRVEVLTLRRQHGDSDRETETAAQALAKPAWMLRELLWGIAGSRGVASPAPQAEAADSGSSAPAGGISFFSSAFPAEKSGGMLLTVVGIYFLYGQWTGDAASLAAILQPSRIAD